MDWKSGNLSLELPHGLEIWESAPWEGNPTGFMNPGRDLHLLQSTSPARQCFLATGNNHDKDCESVIMILPHGMTMIRIVMS